MQTNCFHDFKFLSLLTISNPQHLVTESYIQQVVSEPQQFPLSHIVSVGRHFSFKGLIFEEEL